jgi:hypothetical protein
VQNDLL